jgi:hypothetical protein
MALLSHSAASCLEPDNVPRPRKVGAETIGISLRNGGAI